MESLQKRLYISGTVLLIAGIVLYIFLQRGMYIFLAEMVTFFGIVYLIAGVLNLQKKMIIVALFMILAGIFTLLSEFLEILASFLHLLNSGWYFGLIWLGIGTFFLLFSNRN